MKTCNEILVDDEYKLLIACSVHSIIHEKHDDLLDRHDNASIILKRPLRRVTTYVIALLSHRVFTQSSNPLLMKESHKR